MVKKKITKSRKDSYANAIIPTKVLEFLTKEGIGTSANVLLYLAHDFSIGHIGQAGEEYPRDAGDLRRCILLSEASPKVKALLPEMAKKSKPWATIIKHWDLLINVLDITAPQWRLDVHQVAGSLPSIVTPASLQTINHIMRALFAHVDKEEKPNAFEFMNSDT